MDAVALAQQLIRCPSVTPADAGALAVLEAALNPLGFVCHRLKFGAVENLYARIGERAPHFCFAGHTDVVPPGEGWRYDPFAAEIRDGTLYGRGAADMKSAIAAFVVAAGQFLEKKKPNGSISLLITGDEEGEAADGTVKLLDWLKGRGESIDHCVVGEPSAAARAGDTLKIGRRGSINFQVTVQGIQGHAAYPHRAKNPIPALALLITRLSAHVLDTGSSAHFEPSTLTFVTVDVGNRASNVIPGEARAGFNIRFNDRHTAEGLIAWVAREAAAVTRESGCGIAVASAVSGEAFLTAPGDFTALAAKAVESVTGAAPAFSTGGGTSDARFIKDVCPVVELGLAGTTMHKIDECVPVDEIAILTAIYGALLDLYFAPQ
jgi:succinyl-diaminopimelate desuccinylase